MNFALGFITGLVTSGVIFSILAYFRAAIEKRVVIIEKRLEAAGPKPKGAIFLPEDENEIIRQERIKQNSAAGRDTPLEELR